jgi:hypothetical protein
MLLELLAGLDMAHFAKIENNLVTQVIVVSNDVCGSEYPASEPVGQAFIASINIDGEWLQTSYSSSFRGAYAGIGYTYDVELDEFIAPPVEEI